MPLPNDFLAGLGGGGGWGEEPLAQPDQGGLVNQIAALFGNQQAPEIDHTGGNHYTPDRSFLNIARDVAGTFGDALMMRDGMQPQYQQNRIQRKTARAMGNDFATNPLAAIQRLQEAELPQEAQALDARRLAQDAVRQQQRASESLINQRNAQSERYRNAGVQLLSQLSQGINSQETLDAARARGDSIMARFGLDEAFALPEVYSPENIATWRSMGLTPYQSGQLEQGAQRTAATVANTDNLIENRDASTDIAGALADNTIRTTGRDDNRADAVATETNRHNTASEAIAANRGRGGRASALPPLPADPGVPIKPRGYTLPIASGPHAGKTAYISDGTRWIKQW